MPHGRRSAAQDSLHNFATSRNSRRPQAGLVRGVRQTTEPRVLVSWEGPGKPIVLKILDPVSEVVAVPLLPKRALVLAQELLTRGVQAIKADS